MNRDYTLTLEIVENVANMGWDGNDFIYFEDGMMHIIPRINFVVGKYRPHDLNLVYVH